jgi:secreted PhoX family phosphatase
MKNDPIKNDRIKSGRIKSDRIKTDRIKRITDPSRSSLSSFRSCGVGVKEWGTTLTSESQQIYSSFEGDAELGYNSHAAAYF